MKTIKFIVLVLVSLAFTTAGFSQGRRHGHGGHHKHHGGKVVVVKRSPYRPKKVVVYHPAWRPAYAYNRRWVYFPKYNIYWDNWRNHYRFWNGTIWISQPAPPPIVVNVNLAEEKHYELKDDDDDNDDIDNSNTTHKTEFKAD